MNSEPEWEAIRSRAARRLPSGFARATVRRAQQERRQKLRVRSALLTAAILFLAVNAGRGFDALSALSAPRAERTPVAAVSATSQDSAEWARQRMGVDL